jgi:hypothetical protein
MLVNRITLSRSMLVLCAAMFLAFLGFGVGCSSDDLIPEEPQGTTSNYYGVYSDPSGAPGTIELTGISYPTAAAPATAKLLPGGTGNLIPLTGEVHIAGQGTISVTGAYDVDNGYIYFSSSDETYSFSGSVTAGQAIGISYVPGGQGSFILLVGATSSSVTTYCGGVVCDTPKGCDASGSFSVMVSGAVALMTANYQGASGSGVGTATATAVDFHIQQGPVDITIHGDVAGGGVTGDWTDNNNGYAGTWSGTAAECTAGPLLRR